VNEDQTATVTLDLCNVCYKTIQTHFTEGTMPAGATKQSLILSYEHDPSPNSEIFYKSYQT
jgi:hypothetical protein